MNPSPTVASAARDAARRLRAPERPRTILAVVAASVGGQVHVLPQTDSVPVPAWIVTGISPSVGDTVRVEIHDGVWTVTGIVTDQPHDTGWVAASRAGYQIRRVGRVVYFRGSETYTGSGVANATAWSAAMIPSGFRPDTDTAIIGEMNGRPVTAVARANGEVQATNHTGATRTAFRCSGSWVLE